MTIRTSSKFIGQFIYVEQLKMRNYIIERLNLPVLNNLKYEILLCEMRQINLLTLLFFFVKRWSTN